MWEFGFSAPLQGAEYDWIYEDAGPRAIDREADPQTMTARVGETWSAREFPTLVALYEWFVAHPERGDVRIHELMAVVDPVQADNHGWGRALDHLERAGYVEALRIDHPYPIAILRLTERGLRAVGAWPTESNPVQVLVHVLNLEAKAADETDPGKASRLRKAAASLGSVAGDMTTDVIAKFLAHLAAGQG